MPNINDNIWTLKHETSFTFRNKGEKMPIALAPRGQDLRVLKITADEETKRHLEDIGITVNSTIQVISKSGKTSICLVKNSRLALDGTLSMKILVA